jgi:hypothetical protein
MTLATKPAHAKMKPEIKTAWVAALRSKSYKQGRGALHRIVDGDGTEDRFCCLGVLCAVGAEMGAVARREPRDGYTRYSYKLAGLGDEEHFYDMMPTTRIADWAGVDDGAVNQLASFNDSSGYTFTQIADYIEEHL